MANLYAILREGFSDRGDNTFLERPGGDSMTFAQLDFLSARFAALFDSLELTQGDRVVVQVAKSAASVAVYLACLRRGLIYVPLNTAYTAGEIAYFLEDAEPGLVVCDAELTDGVEELVADKVPAAACYTLTQGESGSLVDAAAGMPPQTALAQLDEDAHAAMLYTSGTTGRAKGAVLTIDNLASNARTLYRLWGWQRDDVLVHALPIFHAHGLFVALHLALLGGNTVRFLPQFSVEGIRAALPGATVMMGVPTFYTRLLGDEQFGRADCAHLRLCISGSAPLSAATFNAFEARTGQRILERYGMTEALMITSNPYDGERVPGSVGFPLTDIEVRIADEKGRQAPGGTIGEIQIRGPNVFAGYWRQPEKTAAEFTDDGFFTSGDLGSVDAAGRLTIAGRSKDLIISGGYNIYPKEIESQLDAMPGINESAVIGVPDSDFGEALLAVVVSQESAEQLQERVLCELTDKLARFKLPRQVVVIDELPRNALGKVQKQALRDRFAAVNTTKAAAPPRDQ